MPSEHANFYEAIKGFSTKRLIRIRGFYRVARDTRHAEGLPMLSHDEECLKAINKELRLRTKRRYGKAV